ncbi:MAG: hypothetical protein EA388_02960 [Nitriliruptor sp.]|nr:MAG: hypothetical protein EA388_02960 [Nitriliruptor sp.]
MSVPDRRVVLGLQRTIRRDGAIGQGRLELTETTVRRAREALFRFGVDHTVAAIDADLRRAADHDELQTRCTRSLGRPVRIRDRDEQARLLVLAAQRSLVRPSIASVLELGDHQIRWSGVLATRVVYGRVQLGVADLVEPGVDPFTATGRVRTAQMVAWLLAEPGVPALLPAIPDGEPLVVSGAAATGIAAAVLHRRWGPQRPELEATHVTRDDLETLRAELVARSLGERLLVPGIDPAETDHVAAAVAVAIELTDRVGADGIVVTRAELFHGQVLQILDALTPIATPVAAAAPGPAPAPDPGEVVARLAGELFEQLAGVHGLGPRDLDLLQRAARLHANDPVCGRGAPHRRAARALLDNGLRGLCPEQLVEVACLVRFQRGRDPGQHFPPYGRLPADRRRAVDRLTALLRLAMGLDAGRDGAVERILVDVDPELACIHVFGDRPLDLVIHATRSCLSGIQRLLGVDVVVRAAGPVRIDH